LRFTPTSIPDVVVIEPTVFEDARGFFLESYHQGRFASGIGRAVSFVQDNESHSIRSVLRGLHYQVVRPQAKLVRVSEGEVFDVAVDLRRNSPTFGKWVGEILSADNKKQMWIPEGFAHGCLTLSDTAYFHYKVTDYWHPEHDRVIRFDDPQIAIAWPTQTRASGPVQSPIVSERDGNAGSFTDAEVF
jgi:dTDP-4-dehydrorhamnose 3,5-epimerase